MHPPWGRRRAASGRSVTAAGADSIVPGLDTPQRRSNRDRFGAFQVVEPFEHLVVLLKARLFGPVAVGRPAQIAFDATDAAQDRFQARFQLDA